MWFEHGGAPLRCQIPAGVLFDLLVAAGEEGAGALPWESRARHFTVQPAAPATGSGSGSHFCAKAWRNASRVISFASWILMW